MQKHTYMQEWSHCCRWNTIRGNAKVSTKEWMAGVRTEVRRISNTHFNTTCITKSPESMHAHTHLITCRPGTHLATLTITSKVPNWTTIVGGAILSAKSCQYNQCVPRLNGIFRRCLFGHASGLRPSKNWLCSKQPGYAEDWISVLVLWLFLLVCATL